MSKARSATPQIFAVVDSEYKDERAALIAGSSSNESDIGGVTNPNASFVSGCCFDSRVIYFVSIS